VNRPFLPWRPLPLRPLADVCVPVVVLVDVQPSPGRLHPCARASCRESVRWTDSPSPPGTSPRVRRRRGPDLCPGPAPAPATERKGVPRRGPPGLGARLSPPAGPERGHPPGALALGSVSAGTWSASVPKRPGSRSTPRPSRSTIPVASGDPMAGTGRATGPPALGEVNLSGGQIHAPGEGFSGFRLALRPVPRSTGPFPGRAGGHGVGDCSGSQRRAPGGLRPPTVWPGFRTVGRLTRPGETPRERGGRTGRWPVRRVS